MGLGFMALEAMCGALYSFPLALCTVILGISLGVTTCYLLTRFCMKEWFTEVICKNPKLKVVVFAAQANARTIAFLIRFTPLPTGIQTGILAVADIPLYIVLPFAAVAFLPENLVMVYAAGSTISDQSNESTATDSLQVGFYVVSVLLLVVATILLGWMTKRALQHAEQQMTLSDEALTPLTTLESIDEELRETSDDDFQDEDGDENYHAVHGCIYLSDEDDGNHNDEKNTDEEAEEERA